jgi:hypothetical protein
MPRYARDYAAMATLVTSAQVAKAWVRPDRMFAAVSCSRRPGKTVGDLRSRAVILWPVLEPLLMQRVGFSGEDNLAADAEFNPECRLPLIASANLLVARRALRKMTD